jgi:hypothetical protein
MDIKYMEYKMLLSILPIIPFNQINDINSLSIKAAFEGYAINIPAKKNPEDCISLYSKTSKHCFYIEDFDTSFSDKENQNLYFRNLLPFFFNITYIKSNNCPLLLLSIAEEDKQKESQITSSLNDLVNEQGFLGVEILFIYRNRSSNLTGNSFFAYYDFEPYNTREKSEHSQLFADLFLSGKLLEKRMFIKCATTEELIKTSDTINELIADILNQNNQFSQLIQSYHTLSSKNKTLVETTTLLRQKLEDYQIFFHFVKESFNNDLLWHKNENIKIRDWFTIEIKKLKDWHYQQYESLPGWYKKIGKIITKFSGDKKNKKANQVD